MEDERNRPPVLRVTLAAQPTCVPQLRRQVGAWLLSQTSSPSQESGAARDAPSGDHGPADDSGSADAVRAIQQAVSELVTNVVEHAYRDGPEVGSVTVTALVDRRGWAVVEVADTGHWQDRPTPRSHHGRGLTLARGFVDELAITHGSAGTTATIRQRLHQRPGDAADLHTGVVRR